MPRRKLSRPANRTTSRHRHPKTDAGRAFSELVSVMARLRSPNGCPWDREQTHATLRTYLIEEAYEVLDALDSGDDAKFAEELGDLFLQVLFHAQIASEESRFSISDVIREIHEKMIRRHPHVFGTTRAKTAVDVLRNWEIIKRQERLAKTPREVKEVNQAKDVTQAQEKNEPRLRSDSFTSSASSTPDTSLLDGVPRTLPALLEAFQLTRKAARIGFDWDHVDGIFAKLQEETNELRQEMEKWEEEVKRVEAVKEAKKAREAEGKKGAADDSESSTSLTSSTSFTSIEDEVGDLLFVVVNLARFLHIDPEIALKKTTSKFSRRFRSMERLAQEQGTTLARVPRPQLESLWEQAKLLERDVKRGGKRGKLG